MDRRPHGRDVHATSPAEAEHEVRMDVSFVIPSRNQASFLPKCIESCLAQRVDRREIIVVDGESTDETADVLRSFGEHIRWVSEPDRGQSDAVNKGVAMASGDVIAWINSDDYYPDEAVLPDVLNAFNEDDQCDVVYGNGLLVDVEGNPLRDYRSWQIESTREVLLHPVSFVNQPAVFFRKALFERIGGVDISLNWAMDHELWLRMFPAARRVRHIDRVLACATVHPEAKSSAHMLEQICEVRRIRREHLRQLGGHAGDRLRIEAGHAKNLAYYTLVRAGLLGHATG